MNVMLYSAVTLLLAGGGGGVCGGLPGSSLGVSAVARLYL